MFHSNQNFMMSMLLFLLVMKKVLPAIQIPAWPQVQEDLKLLALVKANQSAQEVVESLVVQMLTVKLLQSMIVQIKIQI